MKKDKIYFIYKTTNIKNNKIYIGQHKGFIDDAYLGSGYILKLAIRKHGEAYFKREIIEIVKDKSLLDEREKYYISLYNSTNRKIGYNITKGGGGGDTLTNHPKRRSICAKMKEHHSDYWVGRKHSASSREKIKLHHANFKGENHPNFGKPSYCKNRRWWNDGSKSIMRFESPGSEWKPGRIIKRKNKKRM